MAMCILFVLLGLDQGTVHDLLFVPRTYKQRTFCFSFFKRYFSCSRHKTYPSLHQRSLHISCIGKALHFTRRRRVCCLHLHYQRVMGSSHVLVCLAVVFTQTCSPFMPSGDLVYTKPARSDGEWSHTFFSLFGQWESCQCILGQHSTANRTGERAVQQSAQL